MTEFSYHRADADESALPTHDTSPTEAQLLLEIDERTDRTRRSLGATIGNGLLLVSFIVLPRLPGAPNVFEQFDTVDGLVLPLPALICVVLGAVLYRRVGPRHRAYRLVDAIELCGLHGVPAFFPLLDAGTILMSGGFLVVSAIFWAQGKPSRARLYGGLVALLGVVEVVAFLVRGEADRAALAALFASASVLAYAMTVRVRREGVRAEVQRNHLRASARALHVARERQRIEKSLTQHVGAQLEVLAERLEKEGLPEAKEARRLSDSVTEFVMPSAVPVEVAELASLVEERCQLLGPGISIELVPGDGSLKLGGRSARAVLRVAQELVRNSVVHGQAKTVAVRIEAASEGLRLTVSDDGVGLSPSTFEAATGRLRNAKAWLAEAGGTLQLSTREGFRASLQVELRSAGAQE